MKSACLVVPASLILDRRLTSATKLLWMLLQLDAESKYIETHTGMARETIRSGLTRLESAGWLPAPSAPSAATQTNSLMPVDLLLHKRVGRLAKLLFAGLQLTPRFQNGTGEFTYAELAILTGQSHKPLRSAVRELQDQGWLQISQRNKFCPLQFSLGNPVTALREGDVARARQRLDEAPFTGEALMREFLSLIVDCDEFEDNATPGFLINPYTGEEMQFDRYYPPRVALEFNGPQHYGPTALYAKEDEAKRQLGRDLIKTGICNRRGITLVVVHPEDLSLEGMRQKVCGLLPLRDLEGHEALAKYLNSVGRAYRRKAARTPHLAP